MSEQKLHFSTQPLPDTRDRDPASQLVRLSAAWRRARGQDDSYENIAQSAHAVLRQFPKLAKAYVDRPTALARAPADVDVFADLELFTLEEK